MREVFGNLWEVEADLRVITTNGAVRRDGACVMGRGCALEAKNKFPRIDLKLGELLREHGNRVMRLGRYDGVVIASFPVKSHWREEADPALIRRSACQLVAIAEKFGYERVVIPRPGCGNGRLQWADVRPILAEVLDDRFSVVTFPPRPGRRRRREVDPKANPKAEDRAFRIELHAYGSADDLGLGRYRAHLLEGEYTSKEAAEEEISRQEPLLQAAGAIATMTAVPV